MEASSAPRITSEEERPCQRVFTFHSISAKAWEAIRTTLERLPGVQSISSHGTDDELWVTTDGCLDWTVANALIIETAQFHGYPKIAVEETPFQAY